MPLAGIGPPRPGLRWIGEIPQADRAVRIAAGRVCPSGLNATELTVVYVPLALGRGWPSWWGRVGSAISHSWTAPLENSAPFPLTVLMASMCPSGLNATGSVALS